MRELASSEHRGSVLALVLLASQVGTLGIPRDSKKGRIGILGIPGDSKKGPHAVMPAHELLRKSIAVADLIQGLLESTHP